MGADPSISAAAGRPAGGPIDDAWAHRDELVLYARRLLGAQSELAEDVVQEAFLRLHERAAAAAAVQEARPWLFRVTRNLALDERRRARRGDVIRTSLEVVAPASRGPLEVLQAREETRHALEGLGALPPRERRTVILDQAGLAPPAIARRMQTSTNAVHQSLFRARRRLREGRAAAWGLLPLPLIRLYARAAGSPVLEGLPALSPGSGGRFAGGAGLVGLVAAAVVGGGVVVEQPPVPHPVHRSPAAVGDGVPAAAAVSAGAPLPAPAPRTVAVAVSSRARPSGPVPAARPTPSVRRHPARRVAPASAPGRAVAAPPADRDRPRARVRRDPERRGGARAPEGSRDGDGARWTRSERAEDPERTGGTRRSGAVPEAEEPGDTGRPGGLSRPDEPAVGGDADPPVASSPEAASADAPPSVNAPAPEAPAGSPDPRPDLRPRTVATAREDGPRRR